jgi:hypothetical protein
MNNNNENADYNEKIMDEILDWMNRIDTVLKNKNMISENTSYKFDEFKWLANMAGFGMPVDVSYGTIYLGLIESTPDGYVIQMVDTPKGKQKIKQGGKNKFKTKQAAAETLHKTWSVLRGGNVQDKEGEEWKTVDEGLFDPLPPVHNDVGLKHHQNTLKWAQSELDKARDEHDYAKVEQSKRWVSDAKSQVEREVYLRNSREQEYALALKNAKGWNDFWKTTTPTSTPSTPSPTLSSMSNSEGEFMIALFWIAAFTFFATGIEGGAILGDKWSAGNDATEKLMPWLAGSNAFISSALFLWYNLTKKAPFTYGEWIKDKTAWMVKDMENSPPKETIEKVKKAVKTIKSSPLKKNLKSPPTSFKVDKLIKMKPFSGKLKRPKPGLHESLDMPSLKQLLEEVIKETKV